MKNLQEKVSEYLKQTSLDEITLENIEQAFKSIDTKDEETDLYLSHCLVNEKQEEEKVIKFLEILFQNGLSPNQKGYAEYNFIALALYGAENKDTVIPYPLSFFEKIIPLAKKYGFDVNSKDEDGDTLVHTAIYSEDYFDDIEPIIRLLGQEFDLTATNNIKATILDALKESLEKARRKKDKKWEEKLVKNEKIISEIISAALNDKESIVIPSFNQTSITIEDYINKEARDKRIIEEINNLNSNTSNEELQILETKIASSQVDSQKKKELKNLFLSKRQEILIQRGEKIEESFKKLTIHSSLEECQALRKRIIESLLPNTKIELWIKKLNKLEQIIQEQLRLQDLKSSINHIQTIEDIKECLTKASKISKPEVQQKIIDGLNEKLEEALRIQEKYKELYEQILKLKQRVDFTALNTFEIEGKPDHTWNIHTMEEKIKEMEEIIATTTLKIEKTMIHNIQIKLDKIKEIENETGIHLIQDIKNQLDFSTSGTSSRRTGKPKEKIKL